MSVESSSRLQTPDEVTPVTISKVSEDPDKSVDGEIQRDPDPEQPETGVPGGDQEPDGDGETKLQQRSQSQSGKTAGKISSQQPCY